MKDTLNQEPETNVEETVPDELAGVVIDDGEEIVEDTQDGEAEEQTADSDESDANVGVVDGEETGIEDPEDQNKVNFAFAEEKRKRKEAQESAEKAAEELAKIKEQYGVDENKGRPVVPDLPDTYDTDYDEKMAAYKSALKSATEYDVRQAIQAEQQQEAQATQQAKVKEHAATVAKTFEDRATALGIKDDTMKKIQETVSPYVTPQNADLVEHVLTSKDGPLVMQYLAETPGELDKLVGMTVPQATLHIANKVTPEARKLAPKSTETPAPPKKIGSRGKTKQEDPFLAGVVID